MDKKNIDVKGSHNISAAGDVSIFSVNGSYKDIAEIFEAADQSFRRNVEESGIVFRGDQEIVFSSEKLFTSLMQIGIPFDAAVRIPFQIVSVLSSIKDAEPEKVFTTSDIRVAAVRSIDALAYQNHTAEEVIVWSSAYIRRFGNPGNDYLMVIDNGTEKPLTHEYAQTVIIPHLLRRIIGADECNSPEVQFPEIFTTSQLDRMSREILKSVTALNLYSIRYKTLLNLLQDIILEPPHPWIVSKDSRVVITNHNIAKATHHYSLIAQPGKITNPALFNQSASECCMHLPAAILGHYGAFLGVNNRYGLLELIRLLKLKRKNIALWSFCSINDIELDLARINCTVSSLLNRLERIQHHLISPDNEAKFRNVADACLHLAEIVLALCPGYEANYKLQRTLEILNK